MTVLLKVQNLSQSFDGHAVFRSLTFEMPVGQPLALLGSSGCGKSTLLRLLAGLDAPEQGQIWIDGRLVSEQGRVLVPPFERKLAMVFQDLALWPTLSAVENVLLGMARSALSCAQRREQAMESLKKCRVAELAGRKPTMLSMGQQQRVALARAVATRPRLLLLDEPFSSLDPAVKEELLVEIQTLACDLEMTVLLVTHDIAEALTVCRNGLVIEEGRIKESGELRTLLASPQSTFLCACARQQHAKYGRHCNEYKEH